MAPVLDGTKVVSVDTTPVGTGQMSTCVRIVPIYSDDGKAGPASLMAKLPADDPTSRSTAAALRSYEIEVNFYRQLAPSLAARTPPCYYAEIDPLTSDFILLLEDIHPARQGDQLAGCTPDQAAAAVDQLAGIHAPRWGDTSLARLDWLARNTAEATALTSQLVTGLFDGFVDRYSARLDPDVLALSRRLMDKLASYMGQRRGPWTVVHGDYRLDNLLFGPPGGPVVVDWQTVAYGPGVSDLSYFLGAGLLPDDRRAVEKDLARAYQDKMRACGVEDLTWDECWSQYRRYSFSGLVMAVAASMLVERTDRGDDMFVTMAQRHGRQALDLEAEALLD